MGTATGAIGTRQFNGLMMGNIPYADRPLNGQLYSSMVFNSSLSDTTESDIEAWASYEYGAQI
jgi:hypothetical protein